MARRNDSTVKAIVFTLFVGLLLFSLYSYQELHGQLRKTEERAEKLTQQHDTLAGQIQGKIPQNMFLSSLLCEI